MRVMTVCRSSMRSTDLIGQLPDAGLDVCLQMLRPLVPRNSAQHVFQAVETLARFACHTKGLLGPLVFRREVGRHRDNLGALSDPRTYGHPRMSTHIARSGDSGSAANFLKPASSNPRASGNLRRDDESGLWPGAAPSQPAAGLRLYLRG